MVSRGLLCPFTFLLWCDKVPNPDSGGSGSLGVKKYPMKGLNDEDYRCKCCRGEVCDTWWRVCDTDGAKRGGLSVLLLAATGYISSSLGGDQLGIE